jgi:hypothetical protein
MQWSAEAEFLFMSEKIVANKQQVYRSVSKLRGRAFLKSVYI